MKPEEIVSFFGRRGFDVVRTASCWWCAEQRGSRLYYSFPTHCLIEPSASEINEVFDRVPRAAAIRFLTADDSRSQRSFIWVTRRPYGLNVLSAKSRNQTRRGIEACLVRKMSWPELVATARQAHDNTMTRHDTRESDSVGFDIGLAACPAYEAWGAFVGESLAAYAVTLSVNDWVHILLQRSVTAHLKNRPNNALVFSIVQEALSRPTVSTVSYGLSPLRALESLDHFKVGMGFVKEDVWQRIVVAPRLRFVVNPITAKPIEVLASLMPNSSRLQKLAGFCRIAAYG